MHVAGGSDAPIELPDPFLGASSLRFSALVLTRVTGLHAAIYRHDSNKRTWREEERLSFDEALYLYTQEGAYTAKQVQI